MNKRTEATKKSKRDRQGGRRSPKIRCLKGQRHRWILGSASRASEAGTLGGERARSHLRGVCRHCHKVRNFHPFAAKSRQEFGALAWKQRVA